MAETSISDPNGTTDLDFTLGELLNEIEPNLKGWTMRELVARCRHNEEWISKQLIQTGLLKNVGARACQNVAGRMCWRPVYAPVK